jgi:LytS/YehU family sensor histidine kinase
MTSIYYLCDQAPQKAKQVTLDFTTYLRKNFSANVSAEPIPFSEELEHTRAYLAVEQAQHEEMLLVEYDTQFTRFRLPPLTLQPIVENAVKHGVNPYAGSLHVTVRTYRTESASVIVVEDNGPGFDTAKIDESHTTLTNIRQRLELMCEGKMEIKSREDRGTMVTVTIPDQRTTG